MTSRTISRTCASGLLLALLLLQPAAPASAFVLGSATLQGTLSHPRWQSGSFPISFEMNDRSLDLLPNLASDSAPDAAIMAAMRAWALAPIELQLMGKSSTTDARKDGINLITFADTPTNRDVVGNFWAWTSTWWVGRTRQWQITEADTVFNPQRRFATDLTPDRRDVQDMLTHELGHALGLEHSPIAAATMYPFGAAGQTLARTLTPDDLAGLSTLYHLAAGATGEITGQVQVGAGKPVFGAHVVAIDGNGIARVGALTDREGAFALSFLPAGDYQVYVEPLDGPMTPANLPTSYYGDPQHPVLTQFRTQFVGGNAAPTPVRVTAGEAMPLINSITVDTVAPRLNPRFIAWSPDGNSFSDSNNLPLQISAGDSAYLVIVGEGLQQATAAGCRISGNDVTLDTNLPERGTTSKGLPYMILSLSVRAGATLGGRSLYVSGNGERAAFTGCLEVAPPP